MALTLTMRAQALIAALSASVLAVGVATVVHRSATDDSASQGQRAGPSTAPFTAEPTPGVTATPSPTATVAPSPSAAPGGTGGSTTGSSGDGSGNGGTGGQQPPGFKPKDGWPDIHGVVTDADGKPLAGIFVTAEENISDGWARDAEAVTDSHGRFRVRCQSDAQVHVSWRAIFVSVFPASGRARASGVPDGAWRRIGPECGLADDPPVHVVLPRGADVVGTLLDKNGAPDVGTRSRIGVRCDGLPHGFISGFAPQVSFAVDPATARFRVYGLDTDHCQLGIIEPDGTRTQLSGDLSLTEGQILHQDLHETS